MHLGCSKPFCRAKPSCTITTHFFMARAHLCKVNCKDSSTRAEGKWWKSQFPQGRADGISTWKGARVREPSVSQTIAPMWINSRGRHLLRNPFPLHSENCNLIISHLLPPLFHPSIPPSPTQLPSLTLSVIFPLCRRDSKRRRREINSNCCVKKRDVIRMRRGS